MLLSQELIFPGLLIIKGSNTSSAEIFSWDNSLYCLVSQQYWDQDQTHLVLRNGFHKCSAVTSRAKYYKKHKGNSNPLLHFSCHFDVGQTFETRNKNSCFCFVVVLTCPGSRTRTRATLQSGTNSIKCPWSNWINFLSLHCLMLLFDFWSDCFAVELTKFPLSFIY